MTHEKGVSINKENPQSTCGQPTESASVNDKHSTLLGKTAMYDGDIFLYCSC